MIRKIILVAMVVLLVGQSTPTPIYNDTNDSANDGWVPSGYDASVDNVTSMITRVGSFVLGIGSVGSLLMTVMLGAVMIMAIGKNGVGIVAGMVVMIAAAYTFIEVGSAEPWMLSIVVAIVMTLAYIAFQRFT